MGNDWLGLGKKGERGKGKGEGGWSSSSSSNGGRTEIRKAFVLYFVKMGIKG